MEASELSPATKRLVIAGTMLALMVAAINQTVVSTALPRIIGELGGLSLFSWVFTSYMLTSTASVPLVGKLSDLYGRKPFLIAGIVIFMVTSAAAGASQTIEQLIVWRAVQGLGAGMIMANSFAVIGDLYPPAERGRYQGLFSGVFGIASVLGPTLGGTLTDHLSWRAVFYINIPFGVAALAVLWFGFPWRRSGPREHAIDYTGAALLASAVVTVLLALTWAGDQFAWSSTQILGLFGLAALLTILFIVAELRAADPVLPMHLFRNRVFVVASSVTFVSGIGMFGTITFMPMFLQGVLGASATNSGIVTSPMMLGMVVASAIAGQLTSRTGRYRSLVLMGGAVLAGGMFLLSTFSPDTTWLMAITGMIVVGFGIGASMPILGLAVQNALPYRLLGVASSSSQFFRQIGGTLGVAVFGTLVTTRLHDNLQSEIPPNVRAQTPPQLLASLEEPQVLLSPKNLDALEAAFAQIPSGSTLFDAAIAAMRVSLADAVALVFLIGAFVALAALAISFFLPEVPLRTTVRSVEPASQTPAPAPATGGGGS